MRTFKSIGMALLAVIVCINLAACSDDDEVKVTSDIMGAAVATPSSAKNGDEISLSIEGNISGSGTASVNGELHYPVIHYLIDGNEVAVSTETTLPFHATYQVEGLTPGEHVLSVNIIPSHENDEYHNRISLATITITE